LLEGEGFTVVVASQAKEAIALLAQQPKIDLLLTDMVMPELSGPELARQMRQLRPGLKILFMSGHGQFHGGELPAFGPGAGFLQKPFSLELLTGRIRELLAEA
ncbi:MAG: response regulator, partial [Desulfuromonadales bacterium]|nr:response regulator [Desulfuromonadales bacterium]